MPAPFPVYRSYCGVLVPLLLREPEVPDWLDEEPFWSFFLS